jgi:hypothetical protein
MTMDLFPAAIYVLVGIILISATSQAILTVKRWNVEANTPYDTIDKVLLFISMIVLLIGALFGIFTASTKRPSRSSHPGDNDLAPEDTGDDKDHESRSDQVVRVIEDQADRAEKHIEEEATDDEVASRGAGLFDPGVEE